MGEGKIKHRTFNIQHLTLNGDRRDVCPTLGNKNADAGVGANIRVIWKMGPRGARPSDIRVHP
jgi:hypothetical protein